MTSATMTAPAVFDPAELDAMDTQSLLLLFQEHQTDEIRWKIVLRYEELVKRVVMQIRGVYTSFADPEDIINEGLITLSKAIDKYDPKLGVKFETYVSKRIRGMVIDLARQQDWVPRNVRKRAKEFDEATTELANLLGRYPSSGELAAHLHLTEEQYHREAACVSINSVLSLNALMDNREEGIQPMELVSGDTEGMPEVVMEESELKDILAQGVAGLQQNEQLVLSLYYVENLHLKDVAQVMGLSSPRVSQLHTRAIGKLRKYLMEYYHLR